VSQQPAASAQLQVDRQVRPSPAIQRVRAVESCAEYSTCRSTIAVAKCVRGVCLRVVCVCAAVAMGCEGRGGQKERLLKMIRLVGNDLTSKVSAEISPLGEVLGHSGR